MPEYKQIMKLFDEAQEKITKYKPETTKIQEQLQKIKKSPPQGLEIGPAKKDQAKGPHSQAKATSF